MIVEKILIEALKREAEISRVAREVLTVFAHRKRDRSIITVKALRQYMLQQGFKNEPDDYANFITFLARQGVGQMMKSSKGKVLGIKNITVSLHSLGNVAMNGTPELKNFSSKPHYHRLELPLEIEKPKVIETKPIIYLTVEISPGKRVEIPFPKGLTPDEIAGIISRLM